MPVEVGSAFVGTDISKRPWALRLTRMQILCLYRFDCRRSHYVIDVCSGVRETARLSVGHGDDKWHSNSIQKQSTLVIAPLSWKPTSEALKEWHALLGISQFYLHSHAVIRERYEPWLCLPNRNWSSFYRSWRDGRLSRP